MVNIRPGPNIFRSSLINTLAVSLLETVPRLQVSYLLALNEHWDCESNNPAVSSSDISVIYPSALQVAAMLQVRDSALTH